jgi:signal transduction histidine kinase
MFESPTNLPADFKEAFIATERHERIHTGKIACLLVAFLMPAGVALDYFVYPGKLKLFLLLRLACAALAVGLLLLHITKLGHRHYRLLGVPTAMLPAFFIAWMIFFTEGASSPYYAGLNLILLAASVVVRWNTIESLIAVGSVLLMYLAACFLKNSPVELSMIFNNLYFLTLTGIIVVVGNHFFTQLRVQEFTARYQLDKSKTELEQTNRKLVELDRLKSRFFANISHELRTPLTLMISPLETLMRRLDRSRDPKSFDLLETMHGNGLRLLNLVNDLLALIRLEAGRMETKSEPLAAAEFIKGLASAVRQMAVEKNIALETEVDAGVGVILTDRDKLEKIVLNLLFNALKFTPDGGRVWLRGERDGDQFVLTVGDTGVGIAEKNLPFVFDRFWQADNSSKRKFQGVGIGLALVKELTEMMTGTVVVHSQEGRGAAFTVRLPYLKAEAPARDGTLVAMPPPEDETDDSGEWLANLYRRAEFFPALAALRSPQNPVALAGRKPVALVADDEPDMRRFLRTELDEDYELIEAVNGLEALEKAGQYLPDIILLDMMMPHMDGLEVCRELRKREATVKIPIILLTARADEETKFDALQMGANDFLAKPFSSTELHARIRNLIESHHYQRKLSKQNADLTTAIEQIKETEMQLVQSEKLASLGRLSAGIIHEINNPLNFTMTGLYALRNKSKNLSPEQRAEHDEILDDVEEGLKRVRNIVSDLRTFTHPGGGTGEPVEVADAVGASLRFLAGEWKDKVGIEQNLPPDEIIWANRNKLIHVFVNLLQNSIDALQEKTFAEGEKPAILIEGRTEGDRGLIIIRDNGPGIDPKLMDKIFDPFFTTKEVGKGMGLGLSICYRIVHNYGGKISVKSEPGKFCEFTLDFPTRDTPDADLETNHHGQFLRL